MVNAVFGEGEVGYAMANAGASRDMPAILPQGIQEPCYGIGRSGMGAGWRFGWRHCYLMAVINILVMVIIMAILYSDVKPRIVGMRTVDCLSKHL